MEFNKSGTKTVEDSLEFPWDLHLLEGQSVLELWAMTPNFNRNLFLQDHHHFLPHWLKFFKMPVTNVWWKVKIESLWIWLLLACKDAKDINLIFHQKSPVLFPSKFGDFWQFLFWKFCNFEIRHLVFLWKQKVSPPTQNKLQISSKQSVLERSFWNETFLEMNFEETHQKILT